jgi:hypothetical protein
LEHCQVRNAFTAGNIIYTGYSNDPTATTADAKWAIQKFLYDGTDVVGIVWADNSDDLIKVWDDRAGYTYQS